VREREREREREKEREIGVVSVLGFMRQGIKHISSLSKRDSMNLVFNTC